MENYQEKYENAFKILKAFYDKARFSNIVEIGAVKNVLEEAFPEIKGNDDTRIKEELTRFIKTAVDKTAIPTEKEEEWLKWIDQQPESEHTNKIVPRFEIGDRIKHISQNITATITDIKDGEYILSDCCGNHMPIEFQDSYELMEKPRFNVDDVLKNKNNNKRIIIKGIAPTKQIYYYCDYNDQEHLNFNFAFSKQDEWTLETNKPKFKVNDFIVWIDDNTLIYKIINVFYDTDGLIRYNVENIMDSSKHQFMASEFENNVRLWTIEDAKRGDILIYPDGTFACFDKILQKGLYLASLIVETNGTIRNYDSCCVLNVQPITKEQREFFRERGHVWSNLFATKPDTPVVEDLSYEYE